MTAVVTGAGHALPPALDQAGLWADRFAEHSGSARPIAEKIWRHSGITTRRGVIDPRVEDVSHWGTGARMQRFMAEAMPLGKEAVAVALDDAGLDPGDVGMFAVASCTGYGTPGLDIRLAADLGMPDTTQRLHIGHMGCYAALPGLGAVADFVMARSRPAVLLCVELTTLHLQPPTDDLQQVVAHALFSDAAAAVVVQPGGAAPRGAPGAGWEVIDTAAVTDASTAAFMTWDVTDLGFRMGLSPEVPGALARHVRPAVDRLLAAHGLAVGDVDGWAVHPGGRRIVEVVGEHLELTAEQLAPAYDVLDTCGNCSSATVLLVLEKVAVAPGGWCVALAFGPGLTLYATLLRRR